MAYTAQGRSEGSKKNLYLLDFCVASLRRGHANLLCIVPILTDVPRKESSQILEITIFGHSYDPRAFSSISSRPGHLPATVWFSCSENHLCQVEYMGWEVTKLRQGGGGAIKVGGGMGWNGVEGGEGGGSARMGWNRGMGQRPKMVQKIIYSSRFVRVILAQGPC